MILGRYTQAVARQALTIEDRIRIENARPSKAVLTLWRETKMRRWRAAVWFPNGVRAGYIGRPDEGLRRLLDHVLEREAPIAPVA